MGAPQQILAAGGVRLTDFTVFSATTSTAVTIAWPGGLQAGDLAVFFDYARNTLGVPTSVVPTGFAQAVNTSESAARAVIAVDILAGSESGDITGMSGSSVNRKVLLIFRGNAPVVGAQINSAQGEGGGSDPVAQVCPASAATKNPVLVFGHYCASAAVDPRTFTPAADAEYSSATTQYVKYRQYTSSPQDTTIDMDDEGVNILQSFYLTFT